MDRESGVRESRKPADGLQCPVCSRINSSRASLLRHVQTIHETRQIFPCRLCHLSFKRKYDLAGHCRIHDTVRHFLCDTCGKGFSRKDNLNLHRRQKHNIGTRSPNKLRTCPLDQSSYLFGPYQDTFQKAYEKSNKHFVGGRGPTPDYPDPLPYKPQVSSTEQTRSTDEQGGLSSQRQTEAPDHDGQDTKPSLTLLQESLSLAAPPSGQHAPAFNPPSLTQHRLPVGPRNRGRGGIVPGPYMSRLATPTSTVVSATALKRARLQGDRVMPDGEGQHKVARQPVGSFTQLAGQQSYTSTMRPPRGVPTAVCPRVSREHRTPTPLQTPIALQTPTSLQTPAHNSSERESLERAFFNPDHSSHIMTELSALWKSGKFLDAAILVGGMKLQAHRMVLFAASSYLRASFDHLNPNTELRLKMPPDIKLDIVFQFLTYIYDGVLKLNTSNVKPLLKISLMLRIDHLSSCCREFLAQAARSGVMAGVQEAAVHTPLLVLVDQRSRDTGHMKVDICTQTLPHTDEGGSPRAVPTLVDFERVFEEGAVERNVVQSDMDLYQEYKTGANTVAGTTDMHTYTSHDTDERVRPMVLIKNEFIDPEYDLSMGNQQITNYGGDEERMSSPSTTGLGCKQDSPVVLPVSGGGSTFCMGIMQVVPGLDLDVSSHSSNELGEHSFRYGVGRSQGAEGVVTGTENGGGGEEFSDKCKSTGETASAPHPQSTQIPTENVEPSSADIRQVHNIQRMDSPNTESGTRDTHTLCLRSSDLCESYSKESSLDEATKQFGTETFLASDLYVHSTKTEPKDPS